MESDGAASFTIVFLTISRYGIRTIGRLLEVDIGIAEGPSGDHVSAYSDGQDGPGRAEFLVEHGLGNVWVQVSHIEGSHRVARRAGIHVGQRVFSGLHDNYEKRFFKLARCFLDNRPPGSASCV